MKIRKPTTHMVEIGPLDGALRLPTGPRIRHGMKTTCAGCGRAVTDEYFIAGFKKGHPNMIIHESCCDVEDPAVAALPSRPAGTGGETGEKNG